MQQRIGSVFICKYFHGCQIFERRIFEVLLLWNANMHDGVLQGNNPRSRSFFATKWKCHFSLLRVLSWSVNVNLWRMMEYLLFTRIGTVFLQSHVQHISRMIEQLIKNRNAIEFRIYNISFVGRYRQKRLSVKNPDNIF